MSGRHAFSGASFNALSDSKVRTAAFALAAGAMIGTAFPTAAATGSGSGAQSLAELTASGDSKTANDANDSAVIASTAGDVADGQIIIENSIAADNADFSFEVTLPTSQMTTRTQTAPAATQAAALAAQPSSIFNTPAGPLLSAEEAGAIVTYARQFVGTPYVYGGTTPSGFDCSGFVQYVYAQFGYSLPRTSGAQAATGYRISAAEAQPGDLVVWGSHHIGIYTGNGNHIAAHKPGIPLSETALYGSYYFVRLG